MRVLFAIFLLFPFFMFSQNRVGINTNLPNSELDIRSLHDTISGELNIANALNTHFLRMQSGKSGLSSSVIWKHGNVLEFGQIYADGTNYSPFVSFDGKTIGLYNTGRSIFIGEGAGTADDGSNNANVAIGSGAMFGSLNSYGNIAIGDSVLTNSSGDYNTAIGAKALYTNTTGHHNTAIGLSSLTFNTVGSENTAIGSGSMLSNVGGIQNTAVGDGSLAGNISGLGNSAVGNSSLTHNTIGIFNTAIGYGTLYWNTSGHENTAIGTWSLGNNTTGRYNTAIGNHSLFQNTTGKDNVALGNSALLWNDSISNLVAVGDSALLSNTTGYKNTAVGSKSLLENINGFENVSIGYHALKNNIGGSGNTATGAEALDTISYGTGNTAYGNSALGELTAGDYNTSVGDYSMGNKTTGAENVAIGSNAMKLHTSGNENTVVGVAAGYGSGNQNTLIGYKAGGGIPQGGTRNGCVYLGYQAGLNGQVDNRLFIDNSSTSQPLIFGEFDTNFIRINGSQEVTEGLTGLGDAFGVKGRSTLSTGYGIYGEATGESAKAIYGYATGTYGKGIHSISTSTHSSANAILAQATGGGSAYAGWFSGRVHIDGDLSKAAGSFKIDHPQDPENKYLYHSFVESPDMMNVYNGNITTDEEGNAIVKLPAYFESLNTEFRYQLTVIGIFAQAIIFEKVNNNQFSIKTDKPHVEVSWLVTGIRNDPYAQKNRIQVEVEKEPENKGKYLRPIEYGKPRTESIGYWDPSLKSLKEK
jgi:hypothetical protein